MRTSRSAAPNASKHTRMDPAACTQAWLGDGLATAWAAGKRLAAMPFDAMRNSHAIAARAGLVQNSMLASRDFEQAMGALERATLGPLARRV